MVHPGVGRSACLLVQARRPPPARSGPAARRACARTHVHSRETQAPGVYARLHEGSTHRAALDGTTCRGTSHGVSWSATRRVVLLRARARSGERYRGWRWLIAPISRGLSTRAGGRGTAVRRATARRVGRVHVRDTPCHGRTHACSAGRHASVRPSSFGHAVRLGAARVRSLPTDRSGG